MSDNRDARSFLNPAEQKKLDKARAKTAARKASSNNDTPRRPWSPQRKLRFATTLLVATLVVAAAVWGISKTGVFKTGTSQAQASTVETSTSPTPNLLGVWGNPASNDATVSIDGSYVALPAYGSTDETAPVDTTGDTGTPASFNPFTHSGHVYKTFKELRDAVKEAKATYYVDSINASARWTGISWDLIESYANNSQLASVSPLAIQIYGGDWTDAQARAEASKLVGKDLAAMLPIFRHPAGILVNSRLVGFEAIDKFLDRRKMVRVSLSRIVFDANGKPIAVRDGSGIFADCDNWWFLVDLKPAPPGKPTPPGGHKPPTPKPHHHTSGKNWRDGSYAKGHAPIGGGPHEGKGPGPLKPRPATPPATPRQQPTPPVVSQPPIGSTPDPTPPPASQPPVVGDPPNTGHTPRPGE